MNGTGIPGACRFDSQIRQATGFVDGKYVPQTCACGGTDVGSNPNEWGDGGFPYWRPKPFVTTGGVYMGYCASIGRYNWTIPSEQCVLLSAIGEVNCQNVRFVAPYGEGGSNWTRYYTFQGTYYGEVDDRDIHVDLFPETVQCTGPVPRIFGADNLLHDFTARSFREYQGDVDNVPFISSGSSYVVFRKPVPSVNVRPFSKDRPMRPRTPIRIGVKPPDALP